MSTGVTSQRGRGQRAGLTRAQIIDAASSLPPDSLTMQAVADRLGVKRSALNYYVADRDELMRLIAADAFGVAYGSTEIPDFVQWQDAVRWYGTSISNALIATGHWVGYFRFQAGAEGGLLDGVEKYISVLKQAGFDVETAGRSLQMLADLAFMWARDRMLAMSEEGHPQAAEINVALASVDPEMYPGARELFEAGDLYDERQLEFYIETVVSGLERSLERP
jgi:AcrR family transcriptional regulator